MKIISNCGEHLRISKCLRTNRLQFEALSTGKWSPIGANLRCERTFAGVRDFVLSVKGAFE